MASQSLQNVVSRPSLNFSSRSKVVPLFHAFHAIKHNAFEIVRVNSFFQIASFFRIAQDKRSSACLAELLPSSTAVRFSLQHELFTAQSTGGSNQGSL